MLASPNKTIAWFNVGKEHVEISVEFVVNSAEIIEIHAEFVEFCVEGFSVHFCLIFFYVLEILLQRKLRMTLTQGLDQTHGELITLVKHHRCNLGI